MPRPAGRSTRVNDTRASDTRANNRRTMPRAMHVSRLYINPDEIPHGMKHMWVAVEQLQVPDFNRADEQSAKGWRPVPRSRHPQFANGGSLIPGRAQTDPYAPFIKVGGLLLCERPAVDVQADRMARQLANDNQVKSISRWRGGEGTDPLLPRVDRDARYGFENPDPEYGHAIIKKDE